MLVNAMHITASVYINDDEPGLLKDYDRFLDKDEIYIFRDEPYSREKLHIIISCEPGSFKEAKDSRKDGDYAISWCREEGKGKVFYTSLGHQPSVWKDEKFQTHLFGGLDWATGQKKGDATPTGKK